MRDQMADAEPDGFSAISRWLSEATPPDNVCKMSVSCRDASHDLPHCQRSLLAFAFGCLRFVPALRDALGLFTRTGVVARSSLNQRLMAFKPPACLLTDVRGKMDSMVC